MFFLRVQSGDIVFNSLGDFCAVQSLPEDVKSLLQKICGFFTMKMA